MRVPARWNTLSSGEAAEDTKPLSKRDPLTRGLLISLGGIFVSSLAVAALLVALALGKLDAPRAATVIGIVTVAIGCILGFQFYRLYAAAQKTGAAVPGELSSAEVIRLPTAEISITRPAQRFIRKRGGAVFVWGKDFGGGFGLLEASTAIPPDQLFQRRTVDDVEVFVSAEVAVPRLKLRLLPLPRPRLFADTGLAVPPPGPVF